MPAAILIPSLIGAGGAIGGALIKSHQTGKAIKAQEQSAEEAMGYLQPYLSTGQQANHTLAGLMGLGGGPTAGQAGGPIAVANPVTGSRPRTDQPSEGLAVPRADQAATLASLSSPGSAQARSTSGYQQPVSLAQGSTVRMRAPDGSIRLVPLGQREQALAAGGQEA